MIEGGNLVVNNLTVVMLREVKIKNLFPGVVHVWLLSENDAEMFIKFVKSLGGRRRHSFPPHPTTVYYICVICRGFFANGKYKRGKGEFDATGREETYPDYDTKA